MREALTNVLSIILIILAALPVSWVVRRRVAAWRYGRDTSIRDHVVVRLPASFDATELVQAASRGADRARRIRSPGGPSSTVVVVGAAKTMTVLREYWEELTSQVNRLAGPSDLPRRVFLTSYETTGLVPPGELWFFGGSLAVTPGERDMRKASDLDFDRDEVPPVRQGPQAQQAPTTLAVAPQNTPGAPSAVSKKWQAAADELSRRNLRRLESLAGTPAADHREPGRTGAGNIVGRLRRGRGGGQPAVSGAEGDFIGVAGVAPTRWDPHPAALSRPGGPAPAGVPGVPGVPGRAGEQALLPNRAPKLRPRPAMWLYPLGDLKLEAATLPASGGLLGRLSEHGRPTVVVPGSDVADRHCEIRPTERGWRVRDLASSSGTYVDGQRVHDEAPIGDGQVLGLGPKIKLRFIVRGPQQLVDRKTMPFGKEPVSQEST